MKLETILELKKKIDELYELLEKIELDFLQLVDDDLWTVGLETKPHFTRDYDVRVVTDLRLTKKYVIRFCEDFGVSLKDYRELDDGYEYIFELENDILEGVNKLEE